MKMKKFAILFVAVLALTALLGSALAGTRIDTDPASLAAANASEAAAGQSGTVDGIIEFDYGGKTYTYYHMNDGASGYFLPVVYMQAALDAAFSVEAPSAEVQGYQAALQSAMSAFLGDSASQAGDELIDNSAALFATDSGTASTGSSTASASAPVVDNSKDDPAGTLSGQSSAKKSGSTPELGDESIPLYVLMAAAAISLAGMLYARKRNLEG